MNSLPLIIFAYMYQPNIPIIYRELQRRSEQRMEKVVFRGSSGAVVIYVIAGVFGYLTWVSHPVELKNLETEKDILNIEYNHVLMTIVSALPRALCPRPTSGCSSPSSPRRRSACCPPRTPTRS